MGWRGGVVRKGGKKEGQDVPNRLTRTRREGGDNKSLDFGKDIFPSLQTLNKVVSVLVLLIIM